MRVLGWMGKYVLGARGALGVEARNTTEARACGTTRLSSSQMECTCVASSSEGARVRGVAGDFCTGSFNWARVALTILVIVWALVTVFIPHEAFADDDENLVNPQQRPDSSFIYDTSIEALGSADAYYDNQTVQVVGEVIGDSIRAGLDNRYRWITLAANEKDSTATVSVLMTAEQAAKIDTYGKYGITGTTLQVRGIFHLVCPEHEGLTDLHADIVTVVEKGKHHEDEFDINAFIPGALATVVGLALMGLFYFLRERQR